MTLCVRLYALTIGISTHTLTWSVTYLKIDTKRPTKISTHTLTWSVTKDPAFEYHCKHISTHTLTWSVTVATKYCPNCGAFQLTRSRGA